MNYETDASGGFWNNELMQMVLSIIRCSLYDTELLLLTCLGLFAAPATKISCRVVSSSLIFCLVKPWVALVAFDIC
jgi:hypothetical protein